MKSQHYNRSDEWSYAAHRRIFDAHEDRKIENTTVPAQRR
jgi:hypothetical protein